MRSVPERILRWAALHPDRYAVVHGSTALTYGALARRVGRLVGRLRALGAGPDTVVALYLPRSEDLVVAATAVLVTGAAYVSVDIGQPHERTRKLLRESGARHLLTVRTLWSVNGDAGPVPLYLDDQVPGQPPVAPSSPGPDALAYLTCTVDASGAPVCVRTEHAALTNLVNWYGECYQATVRDRVAQLSSASSDAFALDVWSCLGHGATLHIADRELVDAPARLVEWLAYQGVTLCAVPGSLAEALLDVPWPPGSRLRTMLVHGERLARYPPKPLPFRLHQVYGPPGVCGHGDVW